MKYKYCYKRKIWSSKNLIKKSTLLKFKKAISYHLNFYNNKNFNLEDFEFRLKKQ